MRAPGIEVAAGAQAIAEAADREADWTMSAIVGAAGLVPGMRALTHGAHAGAGQQGKPRHRRRGADVHRRASRRDHPAGRQRAFRRLPGPDGRGSRRRSSVSSSPPRAGRSATGRWSGWHSATAAEAVAHPNWSMGQRISIDSASMFNKALELIETREYLRLRARADRGDRPSAVHRPRDGRLHRRRDHGASRPRRHAPRHRLCAALARARACARWRGSTSRNWRS